jgi:hypothetical protein
MFVYKSPCPPFSKGDFPDETYSAVNDQYSEGTKSQKKNIKIMP